MHSHQQQCIPGLSIYNILRGGRSTQKDHKIFSLDRDSWSKLLSLLRNTFRHTARFKIAYGFLHLPQLKHIKDTFYLALAFQICQLDRWGMFDWSWTGLSLRRQLVSVSFEPEPNQVVCRLNLIKYILCLNLTTLHPFYNIISSPKSR